MAGKKKVTKKTSKRTSKPKKKKDERRAFFVRAEQDLADLIVDSARKNRRTLNAEVLRLIELGLESEEARVRIEHVGTVTGDPVPRARKITPRSSPPRQRGGDVDGGDASVSGATDVSDVDPDNEDDPFSSADADAKLDNDDGKLQAAAGA